jgi:hypothetical protein
MTQHLLCVPLLMIKCGGGFLKHILLHLWTWLDVLSAVETVLFVSQQRHIAVHSFVFSCVPRMYTLFWETLDICK